MIMRGILNVLFDGLQAMVFAARTNGANEMVFVLSDVTRTDRPAIRPKEVLIDRINRSRFRIPWLDNRRLILSIERNAVPDVRKLDLIRQPSP